MKTDFLSLGALGGAHALQTLLRRAREFKASEPSQSQALAQRTLLLLFEKPSTRTRISFSVAMTQLGGQALFLSGDETQATRGEPLEDIARVAGGMVDAVAVRTDSHQRLEAFADHCQVPVINALSDQLHPCQTLADLMTIEEIFGSLADICIAWVGDGNNSLNSWLEASALLGLKLRYSCPPGYRPDAALAKAAVLAEAVASPDQAVQGAQVVSTDVWVSMNQEGEDHRLKDFAGWQVNEDLMSRAAPDAILLHCLPAHRGQEVSDGVLETPCSKVWQQAENRLHSVKALLEYLLTR